MQFVTLALLAASLVAAAEPYISSPVVQSSLTTETSSPFLTGVTQETSSPFLTGVTQETSSPFLTGVTQESSATNNPFVTGVTRETSLETSETTASFVTGVPNPFYNSTTVIPVPTATDNGAAKVGLGAAGIVAAAALLM